ncbi:MAG: PIN domain-containing protein, partial [Actinomycetota bacterium]
MAQYVDSSALVKLYANEPGSESCEELLRRDLDWVSAGHTEVEVRRTLARVLAGPAFEAARDQFLGHWRRVKVVDLDRA